MSNQDYIEVVDLYQFNREEAANCDLSKVIIFQKKSEEKHPIRVAPTPTYHDLVVTSPVKLPPALTTIRRSLVPREIEQQNLFKKGKSSEIS